MRDHDFVSDGFLALIVTALVQLKLARSRVQLVLGGAGSPRSSSGCTRT